MKYPDCEWMKFSMRTCRRHMFSLEESCHFPFLPLGTGPKLPRKNGGLMMVIYCNVTLHQKSPNIFAILVQQGGAPCDPYPSIANLPALPRVLLSLLHQLLLPQHHQSLPDTKITSGHQIRFTAAVYNPTILCGCTWGC